MLATSDQSSVLLSAFKQGTRFSYKKDEYIIRPGESPTGVFYVESGLVKAFNISKYGEENLLVMRSDHEVFPLIWAITEQERDIIYQAVKPTVLWRLSRDSFVSYMNKHPDALRPLLDMAIEMYRRHSERILNLEYRTVRERLVSFLINMSDRFGVPTKDGILIDAPLRHQDIASSINSSRETTSRELAILSRKGLISNSAFYITIKDKPKMQSFL